MTMQPLLRLYILLKSYLPLFAIESYFNQRCHILFAGKVKKGSKSMLFTEALIWNSGKSMEGFAFRGNSIF